MTQDRPAQDVRLVRRTQCAFCLRSVAQRSAEHPSCSEMLAGQKDPQNKPKFSRNPRPRQGLRKSESQMGLIAPDANHQRSIRMSELFADRLLDAIAEKKAPICVGIDPMFEMLPDAIAGSGRIAQCEQRGGVHRRDLRVHDQAASDRRAARAVREVSVGVFREVLPGRRRGVLQPGAGGA